MKTTYVNYPGTIHGFFSLTRFLQQGLKANDEAAAVMGGVLRDVIAGGARLQSRVFVCCEG